MQLTWVIASSALWCGGVAWGTDSTLLQYKALRINPLDKIAQDAKKYADPLRSKGKKLLSGTDIFRMMMCWGRPNILEHEKCMDFMIEACKKGTTEQGYCAKLRNLLKIQCTQGKELGCKYAKTLGLKTGGQPQTGKKDVNQDDSKDSDGDGVPDDKDAFPENPRESKDSDGDGVGDNSDQHPFDKSRYQKSKKLDSDGDGVPDDKDAFPANPQESKDSDGDGVGDNSDKYPFDKSRFQKSKKLDSDGDGVPDDKDAFPANPQESKDSDGDGVGDKSDLYPLDKSRFHKSNELDFDGDGVPDDKDAFPADPLESKDSDGDGVGDNSDKYPFDKSRFQKTEKLEVAAAPSSSASLKRPYTVNSFPGGIDMKIRELPDQGYNEHSKMLTEHGDMETFTSDWNNEWPASKETEGQTKERICKENSNLLWCRLYLKDRAMRGR